MQGPLEPAKDLASWGGVLHNSCLQTQLPPVCFQAFPEIYPEEKVVEVAEVITA